MEVKPVNTTVLNQNHFKLIFSLHKKLLKNHIAIKKFTKNSITNTIQYFKTKKKQQKLQLKPLSY